jgi:hypothetical protein
MLAANLCPAHLLFAQETNAKQIVWNLRRTGFTVCPVFSNCDKRHITPYWGILQNTKYGVPCIALAKE